MLHATQCPGLNHSSEFMTVNGGNGYDAKGPGRGGGVLFCGGCCGNRLPQPLRIMECPGRLAGKPSMQVGVLHRPINPTTVVTVFYGGVPRCVSTFPKQFPTGMVHRLLVPVAIVYVGHPGRFRRRAKAIDDVPINGKTDAPSWGEWTRVSNGYGDRRSVYRRDFHDVQSDEEHGPVLFGQRGTAVCLFHQDAIPELAIPLEGASTGVRKNK